jgi:iron complex transport system ATP-binding protein
MNLKVAGIEFSYDSFPVLSDINFTLQKGQILCVLGVNGAGKSTLIKCLNRILTPDCGAILVDSQDLFSISRNEIAKRLAYVPQRQSDIRLRVIDTVLLGRKPYIKWKASGEDLGRAMEILCRLGLGQLALRSLSELSGGEAQKVAIARALVHSAKILLLDEPTNNLDLKNQIEVMELIRRIVKTQGLSAIIAIHDLDLAFRFSDDFLFLKDHRIYSLSKKEDLSAETIQQVYGVSVSLMKVAGRTIVVPLE